MSEFCLIDASFVMSNKPLATRGEIYGKLEAEGYTPFLYGPNYRKVKFLEETQDIGKLGIGVGIFVAAMLFTVIIITVAKQGSFKAAFLNLKDDVAFFVVESGIGGGSVLIGGGLLVVSTVMKRNYLNQQFDKDGVEKYLEQIQQAMRNELSRREQTLAQLKKLENRLSPISGKHR